jgi:hypothetical protein
MVKFDLAHELGTQRAVMSVFGAFTLLALVVNLYEVTIPVDALLVIQAVVIFTKIANLTADIRSHKLSQPDD